MGAFEYTALDTRGKEQKGVQEGDTARQVRAALRDRGWVPLSVEEVRRREQRSQQGSKLFRKRIGITDLALFTRQLSTLVRSGLPVEEALRAVSQQTEKPRIKSLIMGVRSRVLEGHSMATAMADYPHVFDELYRSTVEAGEQSGFLTQVLERLADYTETAQAMRQKMMVALLYPILVSMVALGVIVFLLMVVVPKVIDMFDTVGQTLPVLTRGLIAVSDFMGAYGIYLALFIAMLVSAFMYAIKREGPRRRFHKLLLRLPVASKLTRGINTARFARTFSILTASGVPVLEAMRIAAQVIINIPMREAVGEAARKVREGGNIHKALEASGYFPPITVHLIASGEASGNLEEMLDRAAESQEKEVETFVAFAVGLFEPIMILVMGGVTLLIVLAIMLPIFDMNQLVR